ncbi:MAG: hypothetical protein JWM04_1393, partial [Verrucomicrobiales bacterium]|nr:hypothetical protein [Verrucomicrobiales bacterium]
MRQRASWTLLPVILAFLVSFGCSSIPNSSPQAGLAPKSFSRSGTLNITNPVASAEEDPRQNAEAYARFASGIAMELNEKPEAAIEQYYLSSLADPSNEPLALEVGRQYLQKRLYDKAILIFSNAGSLKTSTGLTHAFLARSYLGKGETNLAIKASRVALQKGPQLLLPYQTLSEIYSTQGDFDSAIAVLKDGAAVNEPTPAFLLGITDLMGIMPFKTKEGSDKLRAEAVAILDGVAARKMGNPDLLSKLGESYVLLGQ